jgi:hypothetical protein
VLKLAAGSSTQTVLPFSGLYDPEGVAVDNAGDLYVTDAFNNGRVLKLAAGSATPEVLPFTDLNNPDGVAVDTAGDLYVTDLNNNRVVKLSSAGGAGSSTGTASPGAGTASGGAGTASPQQNKVLVDGQDQGAVEHVRCSTITDGLRLKIGMGDHGVVVILSDANPPAALGVQFSKTFINGGVTLEYDSRKNEGTGQVTKQGNSYKITGTATDPTQQVSKSFEINVTCP